MEYHDTVISTLANEMHSFQLFVVALHTSLGDADAAI